MTIALSGSITEPVMSHRTAKMRTASSAPAGSSREPIASCWSTNSAAAPPTSTPGCSARTSSTSACASRPVAAPGGVTAPDGPGAAPSSCCGCRGVELLAEGSGDDA